MIVVGVVGGVASGKSLVTRRLATLGAIVLDADRIGHEVLLDESIKKSIRQYWGNQVFKPDGQVDRKKLAEIVFNPTRKQDLIRLEKITHPLIEKRLRNQIKQIRESGCAPMIVLDAAIMVKTGWHRLCDEIIYVDATRQLRQQRVGNRDWAPEMLDRREAMQATLEEKRRISSLVIDNNKSKDFTYRQIQDFWNRVVGQPESN